MKSIYRVLDRYAPYAALSMRSLKQYFSGEPEIRLLKRLVPRDRPAIDIGANNGVYSYWLSRYSRSVLAIEPNSDCAGYLTRALGRRAKVLQLACSNTNGDAILQIPVVDGRSNNYRGSLEEGAGKALHAGSFKSVSVKTCRLDDLVTGDVGFLKIDVEGHETTLLEGAHDTLKTRRPRVLIEAEERHKQGTVAAVIQTFRALDYQGAFYYQGQILPIEQFSLEQHQSMAVNTVPRAGHYVNNFIFVPAEESAVLTGVLCAPP